MTDTALARSSDDFWPRDPASHTTHVAINAGNSVFMAALVQPDWDMFQSQHPAALLHASARVVRSATHLCFGLPVAVTLSAGPVWFPRLMHSGPVIVRVLASEGPVFHTTTESSASPSAYPVPLPLRSCRPLLMVLLWGAFLVGDDQIIACGFAGERRPGLCERPPREAQHGAAEAHGAARRERAAVHAAGPPHSGLPVC